MKNRKPLFMNRSGLEIFASLPVIVMLLLTLMIGTGEMIHGQLLKIGESMFGKPEQNVQYFMLRGDLSKPDCNPDINIDEEVAKAVASSANAPKDALDALLSDGPADPNAVRASLLAAQDLCKQKFDLYERVSKNITPQLKTYRTIETGFFFILKFGTDNKSLLLLSLVFVAAIVTTLGNHHIAIRPPSSVNDYRISNGFIATASALLLFSSIRYTQLSATSGVQLDSPIIQYIWIALFLALFLIATKQALRPPATATPGGSLGNAMLSVPLFGLMGVLAGTYFLLHGYESGLAIYSNQMLDFPSIFLNLGLYIWAGMMLKQSRLVDLFINILRPWKMSPEMLTYMILLAAAVPTAYTGASGIFVIAAGSLVYYEVLAAGGSRQFAIAATAMSGSLGVVLRPCLLVVLIAALNKQVTSASLFFWGLDVFLLTSTLFFLASQFFKTTKSELESPKVAIPQSIKAALKLIPYMVLMFAVVFIYEKVLDTKLNESTAPVVMPLVMFIMLIFDKMQKMTPAEIEHEKTHAAYRRQGVEPAIREATNETIGHIGALIMLMALSFSVGGVVERSEVMHFAPTEFSSPWTAMAFLMVAKVVLGMFMDPFGAVILVSGTLAPIAYANGIGPVHFWMMVLVAFELGYLMPPVALNQLLARLVLGDAEVDRADKEVKHMNFYRRYERWILPSIVMTIGLIIVSFAPLAVRDFPVLKPIGDWFSKGDPAQLEEQLKNGGAAEAAPAASPAPTDAAAPAAAAPAADAAPAAPAPMAEPAPATPAAAPAAVASAPAAPAPVAAPAADPAAEVRSAVDAWAAAWAAKDVDKYLAAYGAEFKPANGMARGAWEAQRRERISGKASISVSLDGVDVAVNGDSATVRFTQTYVGDKVKDKVKKTLKLSKKDGSWKIVSEKS